MPSRKPVTKAVIAAAGFGTRFLPQTKAMPKEMLPLVDKPIIQYVVEELVEAGIKDIVIVTGYHKRSIEDHFDAISADLRSNLEQSGKDDLLVQTQQISELANFIYIRQKGPYGNATPLLNAEHLIGDEPFLFAWADDFVKAEPSRFKQLLDVYEQTGGSVLTCIKAKSDEDYERYGIIGGQNIDGSLIKVDNIIEKPGKNRQGLSDFASVGGYLFTPEIFKYLQQDKENLEEGKEFIMQPAIKRMIDDGFHFYGCEIVNGKFYDTGNKLEYLKTVVDFALMHDDLKEDFKSHLRSIID
jgi:UTP--glucose-1-phosphate uridylyltransferase